MAQLTYSEGPAVGKAGMFADSGFRDVISRINATKQLFQVDINAAHDSEDYTITIDGTDYTITSDGTATTEEIRDALVTAVEAGSDPVVLTVDTDIIYIEAASQDTDELTITVTADTPADISITELVEKDQRVPFGKLVVYDPQGDDDQVRLPRATGEVTGQPAGFAVYDPAIETNTAYTDDGGYESRSVMSILRRGRLWVEVEDAVTAYGSVFIRFSASGAEVLGSARSDADTADAVALPSAKFLTGASAGGVALVEINLP